MAEPPTILLVRFRPGVVGLTRRVVHIVPVPSDNSMLERLTAYCGQVIERGQAELIGGPTGTPCAMCLLRAPLPKPKELPPV
jgi:hypothetical protein